MVSIRSEEWRCSWSIIKNSLNNQQHTEKKIKYDIKEMSRKLHLCGTTSAAQKVNMSIAVRRVCLREGTNTKDGLDGECFMMVWYTGLAIDSSRVCV